MDTFIDATTISVPTLGAVDPSEVRSVLERHSFARISGLFDRQALAQCVARVGQSIDPNNDAPTTGEPLEAVYGNFQKFSIGAAKHGGVDRPRFMRTIYNPIWAEDLFGMRRHFVLLAQLRNKLAGKPLDYAVEGVSEGMWTAARLHHFPAGGGFMVGHKDTVLPAAYRERGIGGYYQLLLLLTQKGEDFETGGGFVTIEGREVEYESFCQRGDVVVYDATTLHGVNDIDVTRPFRQGSIAGRISALVTLYADRRGSA